MLSSRKPTTFISKCKKFLHVTSNANPSPPSPEILGRPIRLSIPPNQRGCCNWEEVYLKADPPFFPPHCQVWPFFPIP